MVTPLQEQIELLIGPITQDEFWTAVPKAHAKLWRIVEREGNPDGKRLTVDYAVQLIAEQIEAGRMIKRTAYGFWKSTMNLCDEIIVDNFAGGGGASTGIELATGRPVDIAINHDPDAISMHTINHPYTTHYCESVWDVKPSEVCAGRPVGLMWLSPDCKHFSRAKGGKPVSKNIRGLAWIALRWAATVKPRVIILENVPEFVTWGPLTKDNYLM